jgi:3-hydroxyisobutyrate dehydrogenase
MASIAERAEPEEGVENMTTRVALLGAGTMGYGMAQRLLDTGHPIDVWNRNPAPAARLAQSGATAHAEASEAVSGAAVVVTMLPTGAAVTEVMLDRGTLDALPQGATWAQMGTIGLEATDRLAAEVARRRPDVLFVDAPVTGSREPARTGHLLILASGPDQARPILAPVFEALATRTLWLGPAGAGTRLKLVLNTWLAFDIEAAAEVGALATRLGVPHDSLLDAVTGGTLASGVTLAKLAKMDRGDDSADFSLEWALKDLGLAAAAAGPATAPVAAAIAERWQRLVDEGYGRLDVSAARHGLEATPAVAPKQKA